MNAGQDGVGVWHALLLGIVEGLTEFLPVSSTGHLIVVNRLLGHENPTLEIGIQAGAITAIAVLYRARLLAAARDLLARRAGPGPNLLTLIVTAALPAIALGLLADDWLEARLMTPRVVALTTLAGGALLIMLEGWLAGRRARGVILQGTVASMSLLQALGIGLFQTLALVPGVSRSGSTIAGALLLGFTRGAAAEFSFLVGLPILYGACLLKLWKVRTTLHGALLVDLLVAAVAAFVTAALVVRPFVRFVQRRTFLPFAVYRVVVGIAMLAWLGRG